MVFIQKQSIELEGHFAFLFINTNLVPSFLYQNVLVNFHVSVETYIFEGRIMAPGIWTLKWGKNVNEQYS